MQVEVSLATELIRVELEVVTFGALAVHVAVPVHGTKSMYRMEVLATDPVLGVYVPVALHADQVAMGLNVPDSLADIAAVLAVHGCWLAEAPVGRAFGNWLVDGNGGMDTGNYLLLMYQQQQWT